MKLKRIQAGCGRVTWSAALLASAFASTRAIGQCSTAINTQKIVSDGQPVFETKFGHSIDIDGDTAVIGMPYSDVGSMDTRGEALVFVRSGSDWVFQARLRASNGVAGDHFGWGVSIYQDRIAVGAPNATSVNSDSGAVYVFLRSGSTWAQSAIVTPTLPRSADFGYSVDLSQSSMAVGDPSYDEHPSDPDPEDVIVDSGRAYTYLSAGGTVWTLDASLVPTTASDGGRYGHSVSIDGVDLAVGQAGSGDFVSASNFNWNSSVCTYRRIVATWTLQQELRPASQYQFDEFGTSVSLFDDTILIGAPGKFFAPFGVGAGAAFIFTRSAPGSAWSEHQMLTPSDSKQDYHFGTSVSLASQSDAVVGAPGWLPGIVTPYPIGAAYRFRASSGVWTERSIIPAPTTATSSQCGLSIAAVPSAGGLYVLVGAPRFSTTNRGLGGAVFAFETTTSSFTHTGTIVEPLAIGDGLGGSIAIDGDWAVVGSTTEDTIYGDDTGAARVYHRVGGVWQQHAVLGSDLLRGQDYYGSAVSISGSTIAVTAPYYDSDPIDTGFIDDGIVFIYQRSGDVWTQTQAISASDAQPSDYFGYSVSVKGSRLVIGAHGDNSAEGNNAGAVYIYDLVGNQYVNEVHLTPFQIAAGDSFGSSVSVMSNTRIVVGAIYDDNVATNAGCAYVIDLQPIIGGQAWTVTEELFASDAAANDNFGYSIATSGIDTVLVGAPYDDGAFTDQGAAYIFKAGLPTFNNWDAGSKMAAAAPGTGDAVGLSVSVDGGRVLLGMPFDTNAGGTQTGAGLLFTKVGSVWTELQKFGAADRTDYDYFGAAVAIKGDTILVGAVADDNETGTDAGAVYAFDYATTLPGISSQPPATQTVCYLQVVNLTVTASGAGPFTYQWLKNNVPVTPIDFHNGPGTSATFTIGGGRPYDTGDYSCRITNPCGQVTSTPSHLRVCGADYNCSGSVTVQDIYDFLSAWSSNMPAADYNSVDYGGGLISVQDIYDFLTDWNAGCP